MNQPTDGPSTTEVGAAAKELAENIQAMSFGERGPGHQISNLSRAMGGEYGLGGSGSPLDVVLYLLAKYIEYNEKQKVGVEE